MVHDTALKGGASKVFCRCLLPAARPPPPRLTSCAGGGSAALHATLPTHRPRLEVKASRGAGTTERRSTVLTTRPAGSQPCRQETCMVLHRLMALVECPGASDKPHMYLCRRQYASNSERTRGRAGPQPPSSVSSYAHATGCRPVSSCLKLRVRQTPCRRGCARLSSNGQHGKHKARPWSSALRPARLPPVQLASPVAACRRLRSR